MPDSAAASIRGVYWLSRVEFIVSAGVLLWGILDGDTWLCTMAWLLLWIAAITQDRSVRRGS